MGIIHRNVEDTVGFLAGDHTHIKEILHPRKDPVPLPYSLAHGRLESGKSSKKHTLDGAETYYILKGKGQLIIEDDCFSIRQGYVIVVPAHQKQSLVNNSSEAIDFLCVVSPPWSESGENIL